MHCHAVAGTTGTCTYGRFEVAVGDPRGVKRTQHGHPRARHGAVSGTASHLTHHGSPARSLAPTRSISQLYLSYISVISQYFSYISVFQLYLSISQYFSVYLRYSISRRRERARALSNEEPRTNKQLAAVRGGGIATLSRVQGGVNR